PEGARINPPRLKPMPSKPSVRTASVRVPALPCGGKGFSLTRGSRNPILPRWHMTVRPSRLLGGGLALLAASAGLFLALSRPAPVPPADEGPTGPAWFADVTAEVGLDFVHDAGPVGHFFMPQ